MSVALNDEPQLNLERGGPFFRLMQRIRLIRAGKPDVTRRIVAFLLLTWVPILILSIIQERALGPTPRESFLFDFATYARFLLCVPLLILAEPVIGPRLTIAAQHFLKADLLWQKDLPAFQNAIVRAARLSESVVAEVVLLALAILGAWLSYRGLYARGNLTWHLVSATSGVRFSMTGLWYNVVSVPILQFLFVRWLWRLIIWAGFLWSMSQLKLKLVVTHAYQAGGLGFLGTTHIGIAMLTMAFGSILWAEVAFRIYFEGASIQSYKIVFLACLLSCRVYLPWPIAGFSSAVVKPSAKWLT